MASAREERANHGLTTGIMLAGAALAFGLAACAYGAGKDYAPSSDSTDQGTSATTPPPGDDASAPATPAGNADSGTTPPPGTDAGTTPPPPVDAGPVTCTKTIQAGTVSLSNHVCTDINTQISKGPVTLTYPCAGGAATATFGTQTFTGTVSATGQVNVTNVMPFDLSSCHLESTQTITGPVGAPPLSWSYGERFLSGNCSGDIICTATAKISVQ